LALEDADDDAQKQKLRTPHRLRVIPEDEYVK